MYKNIRKKKIKISYDLFTNTLALLEHLDTDYFEPEVMQVYGYVLRLFKKKKAVHNLRCSYQRICDCCFENGHLEDYSVNGCGKYSDDDLPF